MCTFCGPNKSAFYKIYIFRTMHHAIYIYIYIYIYVCKNDQQDVQFISLIETNKGHKVCIMLVSLTHTCVQCIQKVAVHS